MKRVITYVGPGLLVLAALVSGAVALTTGGGRALAQYHGASIQKVCVSPRGIGQTTDCSIRVTYLDESGDTVRINEASDLVNNYGGPTRVPASGNLQISAVSGNTTCTVGGSLPCNIGAAGSTTDGLPGTGADGRVIFLSDQYVIQAADPSPLNDQGTAKIQDLCDAPGTSGCSSLENTIQFAASTLIAHPSIAVTKSCTDASAPGQPINFSGTVTNTGNVTLNNVTVVDNHAGTVLTLASLAAGASSPYSGSYVPSGSPSTDTVTASGTDVIPETVTATASATCNILTAPNIAVTKSCADASAPGQPINFSGTVTNTGNVTLNNVTVVDNHAGNVLTLASLAAGASSPYSGSYVPSGSPSTDTVTASGTDAINDGAPVTATASAACNIITHPSIAVTKSCTDASAPGQPINFSGTVTNTGNVTLSNVTVADDHAGNVLTLASLAGGASSPYSGSYVPSGSPSTDTVTASGTDAINDGAPVTATASATCRIAATPTPSPTVSPTPTQGVGGITDLHIDGTDAAPADSSSGSALPSAAIAGVAVIMAGLALTASAWYARRRRLG